MRHGMVERSEMKRIMDKGIHVTDHRRYSTAEHAPKDRGRAPHTCQKLVHRYDLTFKGVTGWAAPTLRNF